MTKEIQLSLAFCGALAAMVLISAPVNEMTALTGSGITFFISGGFFYSGIRKYFTDKEQSEQHSRDVIAASFKALIDNQNQTGEQLKSVVEAIENLDDTLNDKLAEMSDTLSVMSDSVNSIKADASNIENNTGKLTALQKSAKSILDEISELSKGIGEVSKVNEALRELMNAMDKQKEFYQTSLNQHKDITSKDYELIEMLARKLK